MNPLPHAYLSAIELSASTSPRLAHGVSLFPAVPVSAFASTGSCQSPVGDGPPSRVGEAQGGTLTFLRKTERTLAAAGLIYASP